MNSYFFSICTAVLLPISFIAVMGNDSPSSAVNHQLGRPNIQPSSQLISDKKSADPAEKIQFYCAKVHNARLNKKVLTTIVQKGTQKFMLVQWVKPMGTYWTPERRCQKFVQRMQLANNVGTMEYIMHGKMNGQQVICTAAKVDGNCRYLLMTLQPGDRPLEILDELKNSLYGRGGMVEQ
jgi:Circadian oscillating protein COP23